MTNQPSNDIERISTLPSASSVFYGLVALLLLLAVGHLYLLQGFTDRYLGLPLWLWLQILVVFAMVGIAWIAVRLYAVATAEVE